MPDVAAAFDAAILFVVVGDLNAVQNPLRCRDLVGTHHHQHLFRGEDTIPGQNIQDRVLSEECPGKVDQIGQHPVVCIRPVRGKFKAVAGLFLFRSSVLGVLDGIVAGTVGVVLGICAVGDHENLHIFVQAAACPERIPLIAVDLVERLPDGHPAPLQFHMNQRKAVDQNRHIVAVIMPRTVCLLHFILVDDLQTVVVDVLFVDQCDIFGTAIIPMQHLHVIFLNLPGLFGNMFVGVGNYITEKLPPLCVRKLVVVQLFQLAAEVGNQFILGMQRQIGIALLTQQPDKLFFQFRLALVAVRAHLGGLIGGNNSIFIGGRNDIEKGHFKFLLPMVFLNIVLNCKIMCFSESVLYQHTQVFRPSSA